MQVSIRLTKRREKTRARAHTRTYAEREKEREWTHACTFYVCHFFCCVSSQRNYWLGFKKTIFVHADTMVITNIALYQLIQKFYSHSISHSLPLPLPPLSLSVCVFFPHVSGIYHKMHMHIKLNAFQKSRVISFYIFQFLSCLVGACFVWVDFD